MREYISKPVFQWGRTLLLFAIFGLPVALAANERHAVTPTNAPPIEYRIQPLDMLDINVYRETDLSLKVRVSQTGNINYPLLGTIPVAGLTVPEVQEKLTKLLAKDYLVDPRVTVSVESSSTQKVVIIGQVKNPGTYEIPITETLTVLQLIARAGGFTDVAATDRVTVIRGEGAKQKKFTVNVAAIIKGGDKNKDVTLEPGDIVSVPETLF